MDVIGPNYVTWRSVIHSSYGPRDNALNLVFFVSSTFFAVSSRFSGAASKSDECQTGTLEHFRQNPQIQDGRRPPWEKR